MMERHEAEKAVAEFLETLRTSGGLELEFQLRTREPESEGVPARLDVELSGPDAALTVERNGELLHAIESLAASILRLGPEEQELVQFDALGFKGSRQTAIESLAAEGVAQVRATERPYVFAPMNSRERRMLHMALAEMGLKTASSGEGARRFVVVYPDGMTPQPEQFTPPSQPRRDGGGRGYGQGGRSFGRPGGRGDRGGSSGSRGDGRRGRPGNGGGAPRERGGEAGAGPTDGGPVERIVLPGERLQRLDPNGNPIESREPEEGAATLSEQERLESLRRAFRKR